MLLAKLLAAEFLGPLSGYLVQYQVLQMGKRRKLFLVLCLLEAL
jgi:hypothetical protein